MKKGLFTFCLAVNALFVYSQKVNSRFTCDSLIGKSYAFLYEHAGDIMEAEVISVNNNSYSAEYKVRSFHNYKSGSGGFTFTQQDNPQWFLFEKGQQFVFLTFNDLPDEVFNPCILFGLKERMGGILELAQARCVETGLPPIIRYHGGGANEDPICGCDGNTYMGSYDAYCHGIRTYNIGNCEEHAERERQAREKGIRESGAK